MNRKFLNYLIITLLLLISVMYDENLFTLSHTYYCCVAVLMLLVLISSVEYIVTLKNTYVNTIKDLENKLYDKVSEISIRNGKIAALENEQQKLKSELNERNIEICRMSELLKNNKDK